MADGQVGAQAGRWLSRQFPKACLSGAWPDGAEALLSGGRGLNRGPLLAGQRSILEAVNRLELAAPSFALGPWLPTFWVIHAWQWASGMWQEVALPKFTAREQRK